MRLGQLHDADLALTEANIHDAQNARIWGMLALVHVLSERDAEAAQV